MSDLEKVKRSKSIVEYAREIGFHPKKIGSYYTLKEHDSVRINPERNIFIRNSTGEKGSIIDFAMCFQRLNFKEAVRELEKAYGNSDKAFENAEEEKDIRVKEKVYTLELPKADANMRNVFAYLTKTRCISGEVVSDMVYRKVLYQDIHKNCVFVSRNKDGKPAFASIRGTNTYKKFIADALGSDYTHGLFIPGENSSRIIITECAIDSLSIMELIGETSGNYKGYDFLALSGCTKAEDMIKNHLSRDYKDAYICLDNDSAGKKSAAFIENLGKELNPNITMHTLFPKVGKDFNDFLIAKKSKEKQRDIAKKEYKDIEL